MAESSGGLAGWLFGKLRGRHVAPPRLAVIERVVLAPRQSLALVEADGRRLLVATSVEGGPAFYPLDRRIAGAAPASVGESSHRRARVSW
jgi:hypothetical protein